MGRHACIWVAFLAACFDPRLPAAVCSADNTSCPPGTTCDVTRGECVGERQLNDAGTEDTQQSSDASDGSPLSSLSTEQLLVRYFFDEAVSGNEPQAAVDHAGDPLLLPIEYTQNLRYSTDLLGNAGLDWALPGSTGSAAAEVDGSKLENLANTTAFSIELVLDLRATAVVPATVVQFAEQNGPADLELNVSRQGQLLQVEVEFAAERVGFYSMSTASRVILHVVVDSTEPQGPDRVKLYVQGTSRPNESNTSLALGEAIDFGANSSFVVGNRRLGGASLDGRIGYLAIYTKVLDFDERLSNSQRLLGNDDR